MGELQAKQTTELSNDLNVITAEINAYKQVAGEAIFEIGRRLKHVKENDLAHGEYIEWLGTVGFDRTTAHRFVKVYEEFGSNVDTWQHIGFRALYEIATLPPDQREKQHTIPSTGETKTVDEMTVRELREVKRALKEAEKRAEQAERYAEEKENEVERLKSRPKPEPRVEVRTEYVEVEDEKTRERLRKYEERFGDIEDYEREGATRITNAKDVTVTVMMFSSNVRDLVKRFSHLKTYKSELHFVDEITKREYQTSVNALQQLVNDLTVVEESTDTIIDIN